MGRYRYGRYVPPDADRGPEKKCSACGLWLPLADFYLNPNSPDNRRSQCKACRSKADHDYHQVHPVKSGRHKRKAERQKGQA